MCVCAWRYDRWKERWQHDSEGALNQGQFTSNTRTAPLGLVDAEAATLRAKHTAACHNQHMHTTCCACVCARVNEQLLLTLQHSTAPTTVVLPAGGRRGRTCPTRRGCHRQETCSRAGSHQRGCGRCHTCRPPPPTSTRRPHATF